MTRYARRKDNTQAEVVSLLPDSKLAFTYCWRIFAPDAPQPIGEHRFFIPRKWRFDWAFVKERIAVEVDGGAYSNGRHVRGTGFEKDCEKFNTATMLGWRVFRFTPQMLERDPAACVTLVRRTLERTISTEKV